MTNEEIIYKNTCNKWLNKLTGEVIYLDKDIDFNKHNPNWFKIPEGASYATYSDNNIRSDVLLFWKNGNKKLSRSDNRICFDPTLPEKGWFAGGSSSMLEFLTAGTYQGKIIWSLFK